MHLTDPYYAEEYERYLDSLSSARRDAERDARIDRCAERDHTGTEWTHFAAPGHEEISCECGETVYREDITDAEWYAEIGKRAPQIWEALTVRIIHDPWASLDPPF